jgi:hypothetical protein
MSTRLAIDIIIYYFRDSRFVSRIIDIFLELFQLAQI